MSVRDALLGILTLGPAYGLQLHYELGRRAPHRTSTNVGQIYATLDRLNKADLVKSAGNNSEGLPLWQLTETGKADALLWLTGEKLTELPEWSELLDTVLITRSVNGRAATALLQRLQALRTPMPEQGADALYSAAVATQQQAVAQWLRVAQAEAQSGELGYETARPKRGRPSSPRIKA